MRPPRSVFLKLLLLLFGLIVTVEAIAQRSEQRSSQPPRIPPTVRSISLPRSPTPFRSFAPGFSHILGDGWIADFHVFATVLPLATAASTLQSFYEDIALHAATTLSSPAARYFIRLGRVDLEIRSQIGDIPWTVVVGFANAMRDLVKMGFTNTYQVNFVNRATGKLLTMSLWVGTVRWG